MKFCRPSAPERRHHARHSTPAGISAIGLDGERGRLALAEVIQLEVEQATESIGLGVGQSSNARQSWV